MTSVINCGEAKHLSSTMKRSNFVLIENYQNLVKSLNESSDSGNDLMLGLDQEVPVLPFCQVKTEPLFLHSDILFEDSQARFIPSYHGNKNTICNNYITNNSSSNSSNNSNSNNIPTSLFEDVGIVESHPGSKSNNNQQQQNNFAANPSSPSFIPPSFSLSSSSSLPSSSSSLRSSHPQEQLLISSSISPVSSSSFSSSTSLSSSAVSQSPLWSSSSSVSSQSSPAAPATFHKQAAAQMIPSSSSFCQFFPSSGSSSLSSSSPLSMSMSSSSVSLSFPYSSPSPLSLSASAPSSLSSLLSSSSASALVVNRTVCPTDTKERTTFVSEQGHNGGTLLSSVPNFLSSPYTDVTSPTSQEEFPQYTDLNNISEMSFYDELISAGPKDSMTTLTASDVKLPVEDTTNVPLEVIAGLMTEDLEQDRIALNLSIDPCSWTTSDVTRWVQWVCQKTGVADISCYLGRLTGEGLCACDAESFSSYGLAGRNVMHELELWKSVNSYELPSLSSGHHDLSSSAGTGHFPFVKSSPHLVFPSPSCSPAPSNGSINSQDVLMASLDNSSEDEMFLSEKEQKPQISASTKKPSSLSRPLFKPISGRGHKKAITLWQFLLELLIGSQDHSDCIRWLNKESRIFKIEDSKKVASLWGKVKNRPAMNYDKLSRSVRQYYKKHIIKKPAQTKRLVYQFCPGIC